jgi:hypothetical protein
MGLCATNGSNWQVNCHLVENRPDYQRFERKDGPVSVAEL